MNRRGFLGLFAGALTAATLDPERALWIPGAKTISIPKPLSPWDFPIVNFQDLDWAKESARFEGGITMSGLFTKLADAYGFTWEIDRESLNVTFRESTH